MAVSVKPEGVVVGLSGVGGFMIEVDGACGDGDCNLTTE